MRLLLDTQIYLWFLADSRKLSRQGRQTIADAEEVFVSAASIWEAALKAALGKLDAVPGDLVAGIDASGFVELSISPQHAARVATLPPYHRDPFDRLLVAQAMHEPLHLLTADAALRRYSELVVTV
ncbi:MAG TPA: type II toxin-antitoxin system VapC family toxin [Stellaceae bacterium]|nr:type II toxin-antitoxin system VapC family toxin [Stellaceae bacterium]